MSMTIATAQAHLDAWLDANLALASNKSFTQADGRQLTREDAALVRAEIESWTRTVKALKAEAAGITNPGFKVAKLS